VLRALAVTALVCAAAPAFADDVVAYDVDGESDASAADPRTAALDDAFSRVAQTALRDLVAGDVRAARKTDLDRDIVGHARLWVAGFSVTADATDNNRRRLSVHVRINRDKLRGKLAELGIGLADGGDHGRSVAVLLRITSPTGVAASYGPDASLDVPGMTALAQALHGNDLAVRRAPTTGAAARGAGDLPLSDDEAAGLAADGHVDVALVAGVQVGDAVALRGLAASAHLVTAHVRMVDPGKHDPIRTGVARAAALGDGADAIATAAGHALVAAVTDAVPPPPQSITTPTAFHGDDAPATAPGVVLVRLPTATPYKLVVAEAKLLAGATGVSEASIRHAGPAGWVIGATTTLSIDDVAQAAHRPPVAGATVQVKVAGNIVEVQVDAGTAP
jgi:hypothetical protein